MTVSTTFATACSVHSAGDLTKLWTTGTIIGMVADDEVVGETAINGPSNLRKSGIVTGPAALSNVRCIITLPGVGTVIILSWLGPGGYIGHLRVNSSGFLSVIDSASNVYGTDATTPIATGTSHTIEFNWLISAGAGRIQVKLDGNQLDALSSAAFGGSLGAGINTKPTADTTLQDFEVSSNGALTRLNSCIVRNATAVWVDGDNFGVVKKKTVLLRAGAAGDGQYTGTNWLIGGGSSSNKSDIVRTIPFLTDDSQFLKNSGAGGGAGSTDRLTLQLMNSPADVGTLKCVTNTFCIRTTGVGDVNATLNDQNTNGSGGPGSYEPPVAFFPAAAYKIFQLCYDNYLGGVNPWTKGLFDGGATGIEIGMRLEVGA